MGKSKEHSSDLKELITGLNKSGKSLGAISEQLQVLPQSGRKHKLSPAAESGQDGRESTKNHQKANL